MLRNTDQAVTKRGKTNLQYIYDGHWLLFFVCKLFKINNLRAYNGLISFELFFTINLNKKPETRI